MFLCGRNSEGQKAPVFKHTKGNEFWWGSFLVQKCRRKKPRPKSTERASAEGGGWQEALVEAKSIPKEMPLEGSDRQHA